MTLRRNVSALQCETMNTQTNQPILDALAWAYVAAYTPAAERDDYENIVRYREHGGGDLKMDDGDAVAWIRDNVRSLRGLPWPTDKRGIDDLAEAVFDATCRGGDTPMVAARTILDEVLQFPPHLIEHQLAHAVRDPLGRAYNRTAHLPERKQMMQRWADYLDQCQEALEQL